MSCRIPSWKHAQLKSESVRPRQCTREAIKSWSAGRSRKVMPPEIKEVWQVLIVQREMRVASTVSTERMISANTSPDSCSKFVDTRSMLISFTVVQGRTLEKCKSFNSKKS